jgi:hypothetical protein
MDNYQYPGSGINITDPQHWVYCIVKSSAPGPKNKGWYPVPVPGMERRCPVAPPPPPAAAAAVWRVVVRAGQREAWLLGRAPRTATSVQAAIQANKN